MKDIIRMNQLAGIITEGQAKKMLEVLNEEETMTIPSSLVTRYVNMKSVFNDKAKDPELKAKLIPIITDFFPKNQDISYQELVDKFGEETARQTIQLLFSAYLDGRLDRFYTPIDRLYHEYRAFR